MPKQTKTETAPKQTKTAAAPKTEKVATEKVAAEKVAAEAKPVKVSKKKEVAPVAAAPAVAEVAPVAADAAAAAPSDVAPIATDFSDFMGRLQQLSAVISALKTEFRTLEKKATRELKTAAKVSNKRKRKTGNRSPSGFVKPTLISDELATFLGKTTGI